MQHQVFLIHEIQYGILCTVNLTNKKGERGWKWLGMSQLSCFPVKYFWFRGLFVISYVCGTWRKLLHCLCLFFLSVFVLLGRMVMCQTAAEVDKRTHWLRSMPPLQCLYISTCWTSLPYIQYFYTCFDNSFSETCLFHIYKCWIKRLKDWFPCFQHNVSILLLLEGFHVSQPWGLQLLNTHLAIGFWLRKWLHFLLWILFIYLFLKQQHKQLKINKTNKTKANNTLKSKQTKNLY